MTSLSASWGNLISVSSTADDSEYVQLWFQDGDGTIRMVVYHIRRNVVLSVTELRRQ